LEALLAFGDLQLGAEGLKWTNWLSIHHQALSIGTFLLQYERFHDCMPQRWPRHGCKDKIDP
jgi:hypothetical protein